MTLVELLGCILVTFGAPASMFVVTVARNPLAVILLMASAFFWLVSLLLSSLFWFIRMDDQKNKLLIGLFISLVFQEAFRLLFYIILRRARAGLEAVSNQAKETKAPLNMLSMYYSAGLGYGLVSGAFSTVNILRDLAGAGTVGIRGDSQYFFIITSFTALAFILLHVCWGVIFMGSLDSHQLWRKLTGPLGVVCTHAITSGVTILNYRQPDTMPVYAATIVVPYVALVLCGLWAYNIAGGSGRSLKHFVHPPNAANGGSAHTD